MLHQIKALQFYTDLGLQKTVLNPLQMVKLKDFSRPLSVFQVLFKANFIFKDFSRQSFIFKYFSSLCEPCFCFVFEWPFSTGFTALTYPCVLVSLALCAINWSMIWASPQ